nr:acyl-CoA dehydrogenase family protein [uncultured Bacillus sp.]
MDFQLSEEQALIQESIKELAQEFSELTVQEALVSLAEIDMLGMYISEEEGGAGGDFLSYIIALEEVAKESASSALAFAVHSTQAMYAIQKWGSDAVKEKYLSALCKGEKMGSYAFAEGWTGKDMLALEATAVKSENGYVLNGSKTFVYNGGQSDVYVVFANTKKGVGAFAVDSDAEGVSFKKPYRKMGLDQLPVSTLELTNVQIPAENLIGQEGAGLQIASDVADLQNISLSAIAVGLAQTTMDKSIAYGKERQQFNRPILCFEALQEMVGKMVANLDASRLLTYRAAAAKDNGKAFGEQAKIARYIAVKTGEETCNNAIQIHGGYGYSKDLGVEVLLRDMKGLDVFDFQRRPLILTIAKEKIS